MEKILVLSIVISFLFFVAKMFEMKYIEKKQKPLKLIIRDTFAVFVCAMLPLVLFFQFDSKISEIFRFGEANEVVSQIFTDEPGF